MEAWVTPGRVKVPHLKTVWNPTTMSWSIEETTPNPHDYGTLATTSQAYQNITTGIPTDYNQYSGCPVGHVMGPDGVCRPITGFQEVNLPDPTDPTDPTDPFTPSNQYAGGEGSGQQTDPYKEYMASIGTNKFASTGNDYSALPGGMNNWTDEAFYDWGLDKGYITESGIGGPQDSKLKFGIFGVGAQLMNDKKFQWWKDSAIERGLLREFREKHPTEGVISKFELLKKRGEGEGFGGGKLLDITKDKNVDAESTWQSLVVEPVKEYPLYDERTVSAPYDKAANELAIQVINDQFSDEEKRLAEYDKTGYYTNRFGEKFGPGAEIGIQIYQANQFLEELKAQKTQYEDEILKGFSTITEMFDPYLGEWVKKSPGLEAEKRRRELSEKLLAEQQEETSIIKPKFKPEGMFNIGTDAGDSAYNMSTAQTGQYIGSSVYKNPDKASNVGGHYQQDGTFIQSDGTVTTFGSMSDSIYAMINGTAVNNVLDRTFKNKGSANVMHNVADEMLEDGKITSEEHKKVTSYKNKNDYQQDGNNTTIHENGTVTTMGSGTTGTTVGAAGGGVPTGGSGGHQNAGNTGSDSKKEKIICTEMYRQTNLNDWKEAMKLWYLFQKKHLTPTHQVGYHFLFKPFVRGMKKSKILTAIGSHFAKQRTKDIKHIMFGTKFFLLGRIYRIMFEPICYITGLILTRKEKLVWQ